MALNPNKVYAPAAFVYLEEVVSSMDEAAKRKDTLPEFSVVFGENQTAARGRRGTKWHIIPGHGLAFTMIVNNMPEQLPLVVALAVHRAIAEVAGLRVEIKWPNDILYNDEKLAGILVEGHGDTQLIGIGLNINTPEEGLPADFPGTTVEVALGSAVQREELLSKMMLTLRDMCETLRSDGWEALAADYLKECITLNKHVLWRPPVGEELSGEAIGLTPDGGLKLKLDDGTVKTVNSGAIIVPKA
jgi:BirA family biotin operon repressor/biotin-[acetyl-CoA-carboxylase] ligase